jgi:hypothetical protein
MAVVPITEAIAALPKPTSLQFSYPKEWNSEPTGAFGAIADGNASGAAYNVAYQLAQDAAGDKASAAYHAKTGHSINQRNKALFHDLPFRAVQFEWSILPTSAEHAMLIKEFLGMMKVLSAPTLSHAGAIFDFPHVFSLEIRTTGAAGTIFKSDGLALENLTMNYTPVGFWSQHKDGFPTMMNFGMEFKEITLAIRSNLTGGENARLI